jgi:putative membrane protein
MMWGSSQWGGFGMILGPIFMILIVAGIIYLLRLSGAAGPGGGQVAHDRALALLKERYAKAVADWIASLEPNTRFTVRSQEA